MKIIRKQTTRAPLTTVLLVLLLALSIGASSIGFAAWTGARKQSELIEDEYTTIAVPTGRNFEKQSEEGSYLIEAGDRIYNDGTKYISPESAEGTAIESEYYLGTDNRILLSAHISGSTNLSSGTYDPLYYNQDLDRYPYQLAVMALECNWVKRPESPQSSYSERYYAEFKIVDDVCRIDAYDLPPYEDTLLISTALHTADGEMIFEAGKTYLIQGVYWDYYIYGSFEENESGETETVRERDVNGFFVKRSMTLAPENGLLKETTLPTSNLMRKTSDSGLGYYYAPEGTWPHVTEYTGNWQDFLETEDGSVWKEEIIPYYQMNHESAAVILTDDLDGVCYFNTGTATVTEGSAFSDSDYKNGNAVCLVSAAYARINGLSVGDTLNLDLYNSSYEQTSYPVLQGSGRSGLTVTRFPLSEQTRIGVQKDYTIVGIYSAPEWEAGSQSFHADTIFVPKSSVPNADTYAGESIPLLNTVIIRNGSIDEFEDHMAKNDMAGVYTYFDQGYSEAAASVQTMIDNAMRLMMVGIALFVLASLLFLLLFARRTSAVMRSMRLLGVPKKGVWLECLGTLLTQEITAVLLGNVLAVVLYEKITTQLLSSAPALSMESILLCAGIQLGALLLIGGIWMRLLAGRNLMQRSEGGIGWKRSKAVSYGV